MGECEIHENHDHQHGENCGHQAIKHGDHVDYLHDGHLHHIHGDHVDEHRLEVNDVNPANCTSGHVCDGHAVDHVHGQTAVILWFLTVTTLTTWWMAISIISMTVTATTTVL